MFTKLYSAVAVLMIGTPITLGNVDVTINDAKFGESMEINTDTHVLTLTTANSTTLNIKLTTGQGSQLAQLEDTDSSHYVHYSSELTAVTDAQIEPGTNPPDAIPVEDGSPVVLTEGADGTFTITFTAPDSYDFPNC